MKEYCFGLLCKGACVIQYITYMGTESLVICEGAAVCYLQSRLDRSGDLNMHIEKEVNCTKKVRRMISVSFR